MATHDISQIVACRNVDFALCESPYTKCMWHLTGTPPKEEPTAVLLQLVENVADGAWRPAWCKMKTSSSFAL